MLGQQPWSLLGEASAEGVWGLDAGRLEGCNSDVKLGGFQWQEFGGALKGHSIHSNFEMDLLYK